MNGLEIPVGTTYYSNLIITLVNSPTVDQTADLSASFATGFTLEEGTENVIQKIIASANSTTPNFANTATTDEGIFIAPDDLCMVKQELQLMQSHMQIQIQAR